MVSIAKDPTKVNPARAGMILLLIGGEIENTCKPRASGDDPDIALLGKWVIP